MNEIEKHNELADIEIEQDAADWGSRLLLFVAMWLILAVTVMVSWDIVPVQEWFGISEEETSIESKEEAVNYKTVIAGKWRWDIKGLER